MPHIFRLLPMLVFLLALAALGPGRVTAAPAVPPHGFVGVASAIVYDLDHDAILFEQNPDERIPPASLTKVLSMFLALDHIRAGHATLNSPVLVSGLAARAGGSRMGLKAREEVRLEELLMGMAVSSGNDASMAVAEFVGGSTPAFVNMMNVKARALGMRDSVFRNPHGLPAKGQYTTARDMLTLSRAYLRAYPDAIQFHNTPTLKHNGRITSNKNPLLGQYPGADGLKTGWINASGYNLIFTAGRDDRRLLAVILGAPDVRMRGVEACRLLDAGFLVCENQAVSVTEALTRMPAQKYRIHVRGASGGEAKQYAQSRVEARKPDKHNRQNKELKKSKKRTTGKQGHTRHSAKQARARAS